MNPPTRTLARPLLFALGAACLLIGGTDTVRTQAAQKSIFVSVIDANGAPVTDLSAADFAVREDNTDREVLSAKLSTEPLRVALLADTSTETETYVRELRLGLKAFVSAVLERSPESQISLWEFGQASVRLHDFSGDAAALHHEAGRLFPKPRAGSVLLEGLFDASEALGNRPSRRRAIVVLNLEPSSEQSRQEPKKVNDSLMRSRAQLWSVSVQKGALKNSQRDVLLNTLIRNAGGRREFIVAASAIESYMRQYAAALTAQYELTYSRPPGKAEIVLTGVRREGVKVIAGIFAPR